MIEAKASMVTLLPACRRRDDMGDRLLLRRLRWLRSLLRLLELLQQTI